MKTSLYVVIALSFFAAVTAAGRSRKDYGRKSSAQSAVQAFALVSNTDLQKICEPSIVGDFKNWFDGWIIRNLINRPFSFPRSTAAEMKKDIGSHVDIIDGYIKSFLAKAAELPKFTNLYFDVEVKDLVSRINEILADPIDNPYDNPDHVDKLAAVAGPYVEEIITSVSGKELFINSIENIGDVFYQEDKSEDDPQLPAQFSLRPILEENKRVIIPTLKKIIKLAANEPATGAFDKLSQKDKDFLQVFFDKFKYLLTPEEHKKTVIEALTHLPEEKAVKSHPFVAAPLLKELASVDSDFKPTILRDLFIVDFHPDYTLEQLHEASDDVYFSWDIFKAFDGISYESYVSKEDKTPSGKTTRKIARMHHMLYRIYTFARNDRTLLPGDDKEVIPVLRKLYKWVLETKMFDDPITTDDGVINEGKKLHALLPPNKFKRYFLPLLQLICSKIPDCDILKNDKQRVVDKFVGYKNPDELKAKKNIASLIPTNILDAIMQDAGVKVLNDFAEDLLDALNVPIDEPELDEDDGQLPTEDNDNPDVNLLREGDTPKDPKKKVDDKVFGLSPKLSPTRPQGEEPMIKKRLNKPKLLTGAALKKADEKFEPIGKTFLPLQDGVMDKSKEAQLDKFLNTIDSTEDPVKKDTMRNLLIRFIYKSYQENKSEDPKKPNPVQQLVKKTNDNLTTKLRALIDYDKTLGFRNFFFKTISNDARDRFSAILTPEDELTYEYDFVYYIFYAQADKYAALVKELSKTHPKTQEMMKKATDDRLAMNTGFCFMPGLTGQPANNLGKQRCELLKPAVLSAQPLHMEKAGGVEFLSHFLDFFRYYEVYGDDAKAVNANYYQVYEQFYQILTHFRRSHIGAVENPHQWVLDKIDYCMNLVESQEQHVNSRLLNGPCVFSYRKYAEVLMFYKTYLLATGKPVKIELQGSRKGDKFNVHTRLFLVFSSHNPQYSNLLNENCKTLTSEPICVSWRLYNHILTFILPNDISLDTFNKRVKDMVEMDSADSRINMLNGLEAAYMFNQASGNVDWARVQNALNSFDSKSKLGLGNVLKFKESDEDKLTRYLIRTYKKFEFSADEANIARFVFDVMETPETDDYRHDSLASFMLYNGKIVPTYIKVFLQFAVKDQHFRRVAKLLIKSGISTDLISINDAKRDKVASSLLVIARTSKPQEIHKNIYDEFQKTYAEMLGQCNAIAANSVQNDLEDSSLFDPFAELLEIEEEQKQVIHEEQHEAVRVLESIQETSLTVKVSSEADFKQIEEQLKKNLVHSSIDKNIVMEVYVQEQTEEDDEDSEGDDGEEFEDVEDIKVSSETLEYSTEGAQEISEKIAQNILSKIGKLTKEDKVDIEKLPVEKLSGIKLPTSEVTNILQKTMSGPEYQALLNRLRQARQEARLREHNRGRRVVSKAEKKRKNRQRKVDELAQQKDQKRKEKNQKVQLVI